MTPSRVLSLAAPLALALCLAAPQARASSELAASQCLEPGEAAEDLAEFFEETETGELGPRACRKLCRALHGLCVQNVRSRARCVKGHDAFWFRLSRRLCADDPECRAEVAEQARSCRQELGQEVEDARQGCRELGATCAERCGPDDLREPVS